MTSVAMSSGHSLYVAGAIDLVKEVEKARDITNRLADLVDDVMPVHKFHDDVSRTQKENINRIVTWHNRTGAKYHYSFHLNASAGTVERDMGVEVLYRYDVDKAHAEALAKAISDATGLKNRGAKKRTDLGFLSAPNRLLIELYFVNSRADVAKMDEVHEVNACAMAIAKTICKQQGIVYTQADNKPHRVKSGEFKTEAAAIKARELMGRYGIASEKWSNIVRDGDGWRVVTGVYASKFAADSAIQKMQEKGILKVAYPINA